MSDTITINVTRNPSTGDGHLIQCTAHSWFNEHTWGGIEFAEAIADRHRKTYHKTLGK